MKKSYAKRLKITKTGKILRKKGGGRHYNAREQRQKQLSRKRWTSFLMKPKTKQRFLK